MTSTNRKCTLLLAGLLALCSTASLPAQEVAGIAAQARQLLEDQHTDAAIELLDGARRDGKTEADLAFLLGVAYQQRVMHSTDPATRDAAVRQAEQAYREATQAPEPGALVEPSLSYAASAHNNLGALYAAIGDDARARSNYAFAIAANDARKGYYALNYARFLETRDVPEAIAMARIAAQAEPQNAEVRGFLGSMLWRHRIDEMLPFASNLTHDGRNQAASEWAMKCLAAGNRPDEERRAWLVLLAHNLTATIRYAPPETSLRDALSRLQTDPAIGRGAIELGEMLFTTRANSDSLSWWRDTRPVASLETSPRDTMRELLRATADALFDDHDAGNDRTAERYLMAAIDMGTHGPDPDSFLRLVELYANQDAFPELTRLMERYEGELFSEKSRAYMENDWQLVYRMHLALGMTYAHIGAWESTHRFRNPFFQLESAQMAAERVNDQAVRANRPERVALPPAAVIMLAQGYTRIDKPEQALKTLVDGTVNLQKAGFTRESARLLDAIPAQQLQLESEAVRLQVEQLKSVAIQPR